MSLVDNKLSQYLNNMSDQALAGFIREVAFSLSEDERRELILKYLPEMHSDEEFDWDSPEDYEEKVWTVPVCRTSYGHRTIEVLATSEEEAIELALDAAGDECFSESSSEYSAPDGAMPKPL